MEVLRKSYQVADLVTQNGTLEYNYDDRHWEYILSGVGDLQLQIKCDRIHANHGIQLKLRDLQF